MANESDPPATLNARTSVRFTPSQLIGLLGGLLAISITAAMAWARVPTTADVQRISAEVTNNAMLVARGDTMDRNARVETRLTATENQSQRTADEIRKLRELVTILVARDFESSPKARATAARVRAQLAAGEDPLE